MMHPYLTVAVIHQHFGSSRRDSGAPSLVYIIYACLAVDGVPDRVSTVAPFGRDAQEVVCEDVVQVGGHMPG